MEAQELMEEVRGILGNTPAGDELDEASKDPSDVALDLLRTHDKLKALLIREINEVDRVWARAYGEAQSAHRYGGASLAAAGLLQYDKSPMKALLQLQERVKEIIGHTQEVARSARSRSGFERRAMSVAHHEETDLLDEDTPQVVQTAKMRVPETKVAGVLGGLGKSKAAGSQDLHVVGSGKDYVVVSGDSSKLATFARHIASRSAKPTVVNPAFGGGGLMAKEDTDEDIDLVFDFPDDAFDDLTEGDVLRAALYEASYYQSGKDTYVDTAFMNAIGKSMKGCTMSHMGFGEFTLKCGKDGEIEFDRMRGKDYPGQSGRSHKIYDNKSGSLVKKMIAAMKGKAKQVKVESREDYEDYLQRFDEAVKIKGDEVYDIFNLPKGGPGAKDPKLQARKSDPKTIATMRKITREHQHQKVGGVMVDAQTAGLIVQIYDKLNGANQAKFAGMDVPAMSKLAWKLAK